MADYIRRDTAIELMKKEAAEMSESFEELGGESGIYAEAYEDAANMLQDMPAADVAEVVHCKDCKYGDYDSKSNGAMVCLRTNDGFWRKETDFCSYGEYRTNSGGNEHE